MMPMPYVCTSRMPGNDQSDPDSRTQTEKPDISSARRNSTGYFPGSTGGSILQDDGLHFDPSFSSLKCVLVMNGVWRYFGSSTTVLTSRITSPFGSGPTRSKYSVIAAFALYGTPFFLKYPSRKFVVVTKSEPPSGAAPRRPRPRPPPPNCGMPLRSTSTV